MFSFFIKYTILSVIFLGLNEFDDYNADLSNNYKNKIRSFLNSLEQFTC